MLLPEEYEDLFEYKALGIWIQFKENWKILMLNLIMLTHIFQGKRLKIKLQKRMIIAYLRKLNHSMDMPHVSHL